MRKYTNALCTGALAALLSFPVVRASAEEPPLPWLAQSSRSAAAADELGSRLGIPEGECRIEILGGLLGGALGGVVGSRVGEGDGKAVATIAGSLIGYILGAAVGRSIDQLDEACVSQVLERAADRQTVAWVDSDGQSRYEVTPTRTFERGQHYCRDYDVDALVQGRSRSGGGTACRDGDGSWREAR